MFYFFICKKQLGKQGVTVHLCHNTHSKNDASGFFSSSSCSLSSAPLSSAHSHLPALICLLSSAPGMIDFLQNCCNIQFYFLFFFCDSICEVLHSFFSLVFLFLFLFCSSLPTKKHTEGRTTKEVLFFCFFGLIWENKTMTDWRQEKIEKREDVFCLWLRFNWFSFSRTDCVCLCFFVILSLLTSTQYTSFAVQLHLLSRLLLLMRKSTFHDLCWYQVVVGKVLRVLLCQSLLLHDNFHSFFTRDLPLLATGFAVQLADNTAQSEQSQGKNVTKKAKKKVKICLSWKKKNQNRHWRLFLLHNKSAPPDQKQKKRKENHKKQTRTK